MRPPLPSSQEYQEWDLPGSEELVTEGNSGPDITKPRNPAFSPAVNIQFFEPRSNVMGLSSLITASACLWTPSKLSMSFLCLDSRFGIEQIPNGAEPELCREGMVCLGPDVKSWHMQLGMPLPFSFLTPGIWSAVIFRQGYGSARRSPQRHVLPWIFTS